MLTKTITRTEILEAISRRVLLPKTRTQHILDQALKIMIEGLVKDGQLKLSSFGTFKVLKKNKRIGRNPKTGKEVVIAPRKVISFHASGILKKRIVEDTVF